MLVWGALLLIGLGGYFVSGQPAETWECSADCALYEALVSVVGKDGMRYLMLLIWAGAAAGALSWGALLFTGRSRLK